MSKRRPADVFFPWPSIVMSWPGAGASIPLWCWSVVSRWWAHPFNESIVDISIWVCPSQRNILKNTINTETQEHIQQRKRDELIVEMKDLNVTRYPSMYNRARSRTTQAGRSAACTVQFRFRTLFQSTHTVRESKKLKQREKIGQSIYSRTDGRDACLPDRRVRRKNIKSTRQKKKKKTKWEEKKKKLKKKEAVALHFLAHEERVSSIRFDGFGIRQPARRTAGTICWQQRRRNRRRIFLMGKRRRRRRR